ncbi:membrane protein [Kitasatospora phosalacinea]|uniref:membrane protein n=1 Tax=Kitasatospora phosalacinea TaxID=2065 RepID=UPI000524AFB7|nr:membrane protein [Kitasatospora phosalacinea]
MAADPSDERELVDLRERIAVLERQGQPRREHHRVRSFFAVLLIVLAAVLTPLGVVAAWSKSQVTDTDRFVSTMAPLASDPSVQGAVANRVTTAVMQQLPITDLINDAAPNDRPLLDAALGKLGPALTSGLTGFVHDQVLRFVRSDAFATVWTGVLRNSHAAFDKVLTGQGGGAVQVKGDTVSLDLAPVVAAVKDRLVAGGLGLASKIPEVHTDYTLVQSDAVRKAQTGLRLLDLAGFWVPVLALLCAVGGIALAARHRRATVWAALGMAAGAGVLGIGLSVFRAIYLDKLPADVDQAAAMAVYDTLVRYLRAAIRMVLALGVVIALAAWLTGAGRRAGWVRHLWRSGPGAVRQAAEGIGMRLGPVGPFVHRWKAWLGWGAVAVAAVVVLTWSYPTAAVVLWTAVVLLAVLAVLEFLDSPADTPGTPDAPGTDGPAGPPAGGKAAAA